MRAQQGLESYGVFHDDRMAQLVCDDVVNNELGSFDDAPVDGDVFLFGTVPPLPFLTANVKFVVWQKQCLGKRLCSR